MKILITGFEPFGGQQINPSWEAVNKLPTAIGSHQIVKAKMPVTFSGSRQKIVELIDEHKPDVLLMVGQKGGSYDINCERIAVNLADSKKADNEGFLPSDLPVCNGAPAAYFATIPLKQVVAALQSEGIPATISNSAGLYVCNCMYFSALHHCAECNMNTRVGFIHVPYLPQQVVEGKKPSMALDVVSRALHVVVATLISNACQPYELV